MFLACFRVIGGMTQIIIHTPTPYILTCVHNGKNAYPFFLEYKGIIRHKLNNKCCDGVGTCMGNVMVSLFDRNISAVTLYPDIRSLLLYPDQNVIL